MVQTNHDAPELSSIHLKLRTQKDRLIAWGLEWADASSAHSGDIDGSLGRAGISDLVASIMCSIRELLDEAERILPLPSLAFHASVPADKLNTASGREAEWTDQNLIRLEEISKDLTTSIDTLCDLSGSQQFQKYESSKEASSTLEKEIGHYSSLRSNLLTAERPIVPAILPESIASTRLDWDQLRVLQSSKQRGSLPPSYESVEAGSEDRVLAYLRPSNVLKDWSEKRVLQSTVLLEYGSVGDTAPMSGQSSFQRRYEEITKSPEGSPADSEIPYIGVLELVGWTIDPRRPRCAFVYKLPDLPPGPGSYSRGVLEPYSLLSFLQNGADRDSTNMPSLEDRFRLAFNLASGIYRLHANGISHRNINSNNVLFFAEQAPVSSTNNKLWKHGIIRKPFVTSFDQCQEDSDKPYQETLISSIYRHPRVVQGQRSSYKLAHDIYSLGLILLEIGLWMSLDKLWKAKYTRADFKLRLQNIYVKKLAAKCGSQYMRVVDYCLTMADDEVLAPDILGQWPSKEAHDTNSRMELFWKAIKPLERCCMIEDLSDAVIPVVPPNAAAQSIVQETKRYLNGAKHENRASNSIASLDLQDPEDPALTPSVEKQEDASTPLPLATGVETPSVNPHVARKCKFRVWSHELPTFYSTYWNTTMFPRLDRILGKIIDRWESCSIDLCMAGETAEVAKPTVYMMCTSIDKATKALQFVNKEKNLFEIKVVKGQVCRSKGGTKRRKGKKEKRPPGLTAGSDAEVYKDGHHSSNLHYQQRPACGASIGVFRDCQNLPPVSFGGTVLVDGEPFGMSVHHMLENDEIDFGLDDGRDRNSSTSSPEFMMPCNATTESLSWCPEGPSEALYPFEISDDEDDDYHSSAGEQESWTFESSGFDELDDDEDDIDMGDTPGVEPGQGHDLIVTQPAIDDVDDNFFPSEKDKDEDHVSSHALGHIYASSGIKRSRRGAITHEVDWVLFKINEARLRNDNIIAGGARHCKVNSTRRAKDSDVLESSSLSDAPSYPCQVVQNEELGGLRVHALGRTSGLQTGAILPAMTLIKMPGRISFSHSWQVRGNFGGLSPRPQDIYSLFISLTFNLLPPDFKTCLKTVSKIYHSGKRFIYHVQPGAFS